jgi:hypothetical protein
MLCVAPAVRYVSSAEDGQEASLLCDLLNRRDGFDCAGAAPAYDVSADGLPERLTMPCADPHVVYWPP